MKNLSFNLSPPLKSNLQMIEMLRKEILLIPISPKNELRLRFEALCARIYWSLNLSGSDVSKKEVVGILSGERLKKKKSELEDVMAIKKAMDYIYFNWLASKKDITIRPFEEIAATLGITNKIQMIYEELNQVLTILRSGNDHPLIQAAIIVAYFGRDLTDHSLGLVGRLCSLLFLYKYGYDFRGLFVPEEYWAKDKDLFRKELTKLGDNFELTGWLVYYSQMAVDVLEKTLGAIKELKFNVEIDASFWQLTERQKEIVASLDDPSATVTNRMLQKKFRVSQITASRDLAHLASLGILYPHGKGRAVYYTKI